jgi:hypothetical protein
MGAIYPIFYNFDLRYHRPEIMKADAETSNELCLFVLKSLQYNLREVGNLCTIMLLQIILEIYKLRKIPVQK